VSKTGEKKNEQCFLVEKSHTSAPGGVNQKPEGKIQKKKQKKEKKKCKKQGKLHLKWKNQSPINKTTWSKPKNGIPTL